MTRELSSPVNELLITCCANSLSLTRKVSGKLPASAFDRPGERHLAVLWNVIDLWYQTYRTLIPTKFLCAQAITALTGDMELNSEQIYSDLFATLRNIEEFDEESLRGTDVWDFVTDQLQILINRAVIAPIMAESDPEEIGTSIVGLMNTFEKTRVSSSEMHDMMAFIPEEISEKTPTGIATIDEITKGGLGPGDVLGLVGPSGGGKTTGAIHIGITFAKERKKNVLYLPYENKIRPEYWRRFIGCACGIPSPIMNQFNNIQEMPEDLRKIVEEEWNEKTAPNFYCCEMLGNGDGVAGIEELLYDFESRGIHIDLVVVDQYYQMLKRWQVMSGSRNTVREDSQSMAMEAMTAAGKYRTSMILLHQKTAAEGSANSATKVKKGEAQEDKGFDNWISYCVGLGNLDANSRFWCNKMKSRHVSHPVDGILELHGDDYKIVDVTHKMTKNHDGIEFKMKPEFRQKAVIGGKRKDAIEAQKAETMKQEGVQGYE